MVMNKEEKAEYMKIWKANNKDKIKIHDRTFYLKHHEDIKERTLKYKKENPNKVKLWRKKEIYNPKILYAQQVANKKIQLKEYCEICGNTEKLERHHWRYDKPLMVNTLCLDCHRIQHNKNIDKQIELLVGA